MPSKKKKFNARFPPARIKKIMQTDEDVGKVAAAVPVIISRALELFIESLIVKASETTKAKRARTLSSSHIKQTIQGEKQFDFLKDLVANIPDVAPSEEDGEPTTRPPAGSGQEQERRQPATAPGQPGQRPRGRPRKKPVEEGGGPSMPPKKRGRKPKAASIPQPAPLPEVESDNTEEDISTESANSETENSCDSRPMQTTSHTPTFPQNQAPSLSSGTTEQLLPFPPAPSAYPQPQAPPTQHLPRDEQTEVLDLSTVSQKKKQTEPQLQPPGGGFMSAQLPPPASFPSAANAHPLTAENKSRDALPSASGAPPKSEPPAPMFVFQNYRGHMTHQPGSSQHTGLPQVFPGRPPLGATHPYLPPTLHQPVSGGGVPSTAGMVPSSGTFLPPAPVPSALPPNNSTDDDDYDT